MHINSPFFDQSTHTTVFDELSSISYTHCRHIKHMHRGVWCKNNIFLQNDSYEIYVKYFF